MGKRIILLLGLLFLTSPCYALTYSTTLANGTTADADEVMGNFNDSKTAIENFDGTQISDGSITNNKISGSAAISPSKISGTITDVNLLTFNNNYRCGVQVLYEAVGNITVTSGEIMINGKLRRTTSSTDSAWTAASTTASGLDTGSEAASTTYYVYACADNPNATTFTIVLSTSSSAPSYTGATNYRKIGSFYNDASSNINSVANTGTDHQGLKCITGKVTATGATMTVTVGFQPIWVKYWKGDDSIANGEAVIIEEATQDMDVDGFSVRQVSASDTFISDAGGAGVHTLTTTGFTIEGSVSTHIYYYMAMGY